ncbi:uncharacterized protein J3R85_008249, partial [Psidium guajava]
IATRAFAQAAGALNGIDDGARARARETMRPTPMDYFSELEDQGTTVAMDVDDVDQLEIFGEGVLSVDNKLADADFFNSFEDDFDDSDIN